MKATFIQSREEIDAQYHRLLPVFQRVPAVDEYRPEQLFDLARNGLAVIGYLENEENVVLVGAMEFIHYPAMTSLNIIALAGGRLSAAYEQFMEPLARFAAQAGAQHIEALCHESMARLLTQYGFKKTNTQMRIRL